MKKIINFLIISFILLSNISFAQRRVDELGEIKRPEEGKLYYEYNSKKMFVYDGSKYVEAFKIGNTIQPDVIIPNTDNIDEVIIGYWDIPERVLIRKVVDGQYWLMQTDPQRSYYITRGINLLDNPQTKVTNLTDRSLLKNKVTSLGGLMPTPNFPENVFFGTGFKLNEKGEYIKIGSAETTIDTKPNTKFNKPIIAIRCDNWAEWKYDPNNRLTWYQHSMISSAGFSMVPEYYKYRPWFSYSIPRMDVNCNVYERGTWKELVEKRWTTLNYKGDSEETLKKEIDFAVEAGINVWNFCYYVGGIRETYKKLPNKKGIQATYFIGGNYGDLDKAIEDIAYSIQQDWYFKIDGKPVVFIGEEIETNSENPYVLAEIKRISGKELYLVLMKYGGFSNSDPAFMKKYGFDAISIYSTPGSASEYAAKDGSMEAGESFLKQTLEANLKVIPTFTMTCYIKAMGTHNPQHPIQGSIGSRGIATNEEIEVGLKRMIELSKHPNVMALQNYSWNEHYEGMLTINPYQNDDGTPNKGVIDVYNKVLK